MPICSECSHDKPIHQMAPRSNALCRKCLRDKRSKGWKRDKQDIDALFKKQKGKCVSCLGTLKHGCHADHIIPLSLGGQNDFRNIQLLCPVCNLTKSNQHPIDFMRSKGFLI